MKLNINNLEQKYQKQVKDIQDSHRRIYTELINNNKELEKEIKALKIENETNKNKKSNNNELNKKLEEINQEKEKYKRLEDSLKSENDKQITELNTKYAKEKETLKKKNRRYRKIYAKPKVKEESFYSNSKKKKRNGISKRII